ncbi:4-hydroxybenzoate 3-monooxygenase [uncultured Enterovirga sp.]|uniref:4-hydroxybenzoate 3-monooxygenase n=1 Tax=uncultured Enterovirga sp. TaxID=2026352 RepID=UPI0035CC6D75
MRTQVGIIGAGPAGLMLSHLLHLHGIDSVIIEARSREYVRGRVRAGVIDSDVAGLFRGTGVGDRMDREGLPQEQMEIRFDGKRRFINWFELVDGRRNVIYGQQEVVKDLLDRRSRDGAAILFDAEAVRIDGLEEDRPTIIFRHGGEERSLRCDLLAACDGFHGIGRGRIPDGHVSIFERQYPFAWLGILVQAPPSSDWLVTCAHERGYAMHSMRSPEVSRNYIQIPLSDAPDDWSDDRVWSELHARIDIDGWTLNEGPIREKAKFDLRSFVCEPMQYRRLFLAGDSAHVVPPTGGRGMNQAIADVCVLADAARDFFRTGSEESLNRYSSVCLARVWHSQQFTASQTQMLQRHSFDDPYLRKQQLAQLEYVTTNRAAATSLAQCYAGARLKTSFLPDSEGQEYPRICEPPRPIFG